MEQSQEKILKARIKEAIDVATYAMSIDGQDHKEWGLDQVVRVLAGEDYDKVVEDFKADTGRDWSLGIEP